MKSILYIGNKLETSKSNVSAITIIGLLLEKEGYQLHYASDKINKVLRLLDMLKTCVLCRRKVDYVIIDTYSTLNFYFALAVSQMCRLLNLKYITRLNGGNLPVRLRKNQVMSKAIFNNAIMNISPSLFLKTAFETLKFNNIVHIPNSIELDKYPFKTKKCDFPKLLWVRSFSEIYNPQLAVKVLKCLKVSFPNAELCMVGPDSDGSLSEVKKLSEELKLDVKFTGKLTKSEWIKLSEEYNIFINTTNYDNTPVSVIEAMALGLPVISTNVGGMPFLIEHNVDGILVDPNDVDNMVSEIKRLSQDEQLVKRLTCNARNKVEQFDWNVVKAKWKELLS